MSLYAIGDIHGTLGALVSIFENHHFEKEDVIIFLGDYVDRGINTKGTIDWLTKYSVEYNFVFLKGNHEIMMSEARKGQSELLKWLYYGGSQTLDSYGIGDDPNWISKIDREHWSFIESGKAYYTIEDFIFVHAGLDPQSILTNQKEEILYWTSQDNPRAYGKDKLVICGHTSQKNGQIADFGHTICIDTYAHGGMWLTCLNVETKEYIKAKANGEIEKGRL